LKNPSNSATDKVFIANGINTLFRQQTQLFGKVVFLTVYAVILAFLFLPATKSNENELFAAMASTYVLDEGELLEVRAARKKALSKIRNLGILTNMTFKAKNDVFCVERAINLLNMAFEAYYDPVILIGFIAHITGILL
jgi:hypothetical protein